MSRPGLLEELRLERLIARDLEREAAEALLRRDYAEALKARAEAQAARKHVQRLERETDNPARR